MAAVDFRPALKSWAKVSRPYGTTAAEQLPKKYSMKVMRFWFITLWGLLSLSVPGWAAAPGYDFIDEPTTRQVLQGIDHVYNLDYDSAVQVFQELIRKDSKNPVGYTYLSFALWTRELNSKKELTIGRVASPEFFGNSKRFKVYVDPNVEATFRDVTQKAIDSAKALLLENRDDPLGLLMLGFAYANLASFETTLKRSWYQAFLKGDLAVKQHKRLMKVRPDIYDTYEIVGASNYLAASIPTWVKWIAFLFHHSGDKSRGKQQLRLTAEKSVFTREDAKMLLALIHTRESNYGEAYRYLSNVHDRYPKNYLLEMDMGALAILMRKYDLAEQTYVSVLKKISERKSNYPLLDKGTVYNHLGEVYMKTRRFDKAIQAFQNALDEGKSDDSSRSTAHLQLGKTYDLLGDRPKAVDEYKKVIAGNNNDGYWQDEARKYLNKPFVSSNQD